MALLAIAYPELKTKDFDWIQSIRARYDLLYYEIIKPHFTLVYPLSKTGQADFANHVRSVAQGTAKIPFVARCATVIYSSLNDLWHIFLVPDEGFSQIVKLHDSLYTDILANELKLQLPFIPHITLGNSENPQVSKSAVDKLNSQDFAIDGLISSVDIISYRSNRVETVASVKLVDI